MSRLSWGGAWRTSGIRFPSVAQENVLAPDLSQINDGKTWNVINADCDTARRRRQTTWSD